jgi:predicted DNA-binding transcriptional regulator AlpA
MEKKMTTNISSSETFLNTEETADYLKTSVSTLAIWRTTGRYSIPYIKIGRKVFYRKSELENWLTSRTMTSTTVCH